MPPSSVLGTALVGDAGAPVVDPADEGAAADIAPPDFEVLPLLDDKVHQLIWNHDSLYDLFSVQQLRHFRFGDCQRA